MGVLVIFRFVRDEENELIKAGAQAAFAPFVNLIDKLFGGSAEEIGGMWQDRLAIRRGIRQLSLLKKLKAAIEEAGFEPRQITDNIWIPAIEAASMEDDESIQDLWANLLANAADSETRAPVRALYITILKDLTSCEARLLNALALDEWNSPITLSHAIKVAADRGLIDQDKEAYPLVATALDVLSRHGLVRFVTKSVPEHANFTDEDGTQEYRLMTVDVSYGYQMTHLADAFLKACRAPKPHAAPKF
jgi:hypothetical protein